MNFSTNCSAIAAECSVLANARRHLCESSLATRIRAVADAVKVHFHFPGGKFEARPGLFSAVRYMLAYARGTDCASNRIAAYAVTSGAQQLRRGARIVARHAVAGAVLFSIFECGVFAVKHCKGRIESAAPEQEKERVEEDCSSRPTTA